RWIRRFGFGERTGIQLPGETAGLVRNVEKWSMLSNAEMSIGQEIGVTPLQVIRAVATVANGGVRVEPRIVDRVEEGDGKVIERRAGSGSRSAGARCARRDRQGGRGRSRRAGGGERRGPNPETNSRRSLA